MRNIFIGVVATALFLLNSESQGETSMRLLKDGLESDNYEIHQLSHPIPFDMDRETFHRFVNIREANLPTAAREYLSRFKDFPDEATVLHSMIKRDYEYGTKWADKNHIVTLVDYKKTGTDSDINPYFWPLSSIIRTEWEGIATFQVDFNGETLEFESFAQKKIFSLRARYWAYIDVYLPAPEFRDQVHVMIIDVDDPNHNLQENGTYLVVPKQGS